MFSKRILSACLVQQFKVHSSRQPRRLFSSSNWRTPWRSSTLLVTSAAVTITGIFLYIKKNHLGFERVRCAEEKKRIPQKKFEGKTVLITGAAGGIGSTAAKAFSEQGAQVVLCDLARTEPKLKQLTTELLSLGSPAVTYISADVTNVDDVKNCVEKTVGEFKNIDVLFNNAGICCDVEPVQNADEELFRQMHDVNVYGVFLMMKYVSNMMIESGKGGVIINTTSQAGLKGSEYIFSYAASKFAVTGMTKAAAKSLAKHNIRVNAIAPYHIHATMGNNVAKALAKKG